MSASGQPLGTLHTRCRPPVSQRMGDGDYWSWPRPLNSTLWERWWHHPGHLGYRWHITITRSHTEKALNGLVLEWCKRSVQSIWFHHFDNRPLYCAPVFRWPQMAGLLSGLIGINESRTDHHHSGTLVPPWSPDVSVNMGINQFNTRDRPWQQMELLLNSDTGC